MRLIVLDLEMNQPSGKIIQIGAVLVDLKKQNMLVDDFNKYVNPHEPLDPYIIDLTNIKQEEVDKAEDITKVLGDFWKWVEGSKCGGNIWAWGTDVEELQKVSIDNALLTPKLRSVNMKYLSFLIRSAIGSKQRGGLKNTMDLFKVQFEGRQHNALVDATNTAYLLKHIFDIFKVIRYIKPKE